MYSCFRHFVSCLILVNRFLEWPKTKRGWRRGRGEKHTHCKMLFGNGFAFAYNKQTKRTTISSQTLWNDGQRLWDPIFRHASLRHRSVINQIPFNEYIREFITIRVPIFVIVAAFCNSPNYITIVNKVN